MGRGRQVAGHKGRQDVHGSRLAVQRLRRRDCHRINGGNIEQRKDPDGQWYSFKHSAEEPSDEYKKFEQGDTKGAQFEETRKLVDSKS